MTETNGTKMEIDEALALIESQLQEVLDKQIYEDVLRKEGRPINIYWGMCQERFKA